MGLIISGAMMISPLIYSPAYAEDESPQVNIDDAGYYYVLNYKSGDCVLCSNAYMIMRSAYTNGSKFFSDITNKKLRKTACTTSTGNIVKHEYSFTYDGLTFNVKYKKLSGDAKERKKKLISMLSKHPEGIVGLGKSKSGNHAVLLTSYEDGTFYAADSAYNKGAYHKGITKYSETIMKDLKSIKHVWYIDEVKGSSKSAYVSQMKVTIKARDKGDQIRLNWTKCGDKTPLDGFKITYVGKNALKKGEGYKLLMRTRLHETMIDDKKNGKSYWYKVRGYIKSSTGKYCYTKSAKVLVTMSDPDEEE